MVFRVNCGSINIGSCENLRIMHNATAHWHMQPPLKPALTWLDWMMDSLKTRTVVVPAGAGVGVNPIPELVGDGGG
jgi:hypothetical protein